MSAFYVSWVGWSPLAEDLSVDPTTANLVDAGRDGSWSRCGSLLELKSALEWFSRFASRNYSIRLFE